jgi:hypothetical protein
MKRWEREPKKKNFGPNRIQTILVMISFMTVIKGSTKCRPIEFVPSIIVDGLLKGKKICAPLFVVGV